MSRTVSIASFTGSVPRRAEHLAPKGHAARAVDCKLSDGTLDSWREPRLVGTVSEGTRSVYQAFECCWLESSECTSWAEGSPEQRHVFATQYPGHDYPVRITLDDDCTPAVYRLGLPCPTDAPVATGPVTYSKGAAARQYAYRFVDSFCNTSGYSAPSETVVVEDGAAVQVSGWNIPAGWDIQEIEILRTASGYEAPLQESENKIDAAWMIVARIPFTQTSYVDTKFNADLNDAAAEDLVEPPPADLRGMTWIKSMNCLAGFAGRAVHFSENNSYYNWPHKLLLDDEVRGLVESNGVIYVATDGAPYVIDGEANCETAGCRRATRMPEPLPMAPCNCGYRSMCAVPSGAVYPTHQGLVFMSGRRAPDIVTKSHYADSDWHLLRPDTMKVQYFEGRLFCFAAGGAFSLAIRDGAGVAAETDMHTELSLRPDELLVSRTGRFYLRFGTEIKEWDRGAQKMPHYWLSGEALIGVPFGFGAAQIRLVAPGEETFKVFCDGYEALSELVYTSDAFPLPLWAVGQEWQMSLSGTAKVKMLSLAPSFTEL